MTKKIEFYFDFLSPYSYLAWTWVRNQNYEFEYYPVSVASIVSSFKTLGPAQIKPKRDYLFKDLLRTTKLNNIPFTTPKELPFNSLYALRLSLKQKVVIDAIFNAGWRDGLDIGNDTVLREVLLNSGQSKEFVDEFFLKMEDRDARVQLKKNIEMALEKNLFGVPSFIYDNEIFWGHDSIKYLEMHLEGIDPLDLNKYNEFAKKHLFSQN